MLRPLLNLPAVYFICSKSTLGSVRDAKPRRMLFGGKILDVLYLYGFFYTPNARCTCSIFHDCLYASELLLCVCFALCIQNNVGWNDEEIS